MAWEYEAYKGEDTSILDSFEHLADALETIGLPQGTNLEYFARLEKTLTMPAEEFVAEIRKHRAEEARVARARRLKRRRG